MPCRTSSSGACLLHRVRSEARLLSGMELQRRQPLDRRGRTRERHQRQRHRMPCVQVLLRTEMARVQRIRLVAGSLNLFFRFGCQAPVHSACHVLVSCKRWRRKRRGRPGDWETKRAAHGRRGHRQPRDEGRQGSTCAQRSQESGAAHELRWPPRGLLCCSAGFLVPMQFQGCYSANSEFGGV